MVLEQSAVESWKTKQKQELYSVGSLFIVAYIFFLFTIYKGIHSYIQITLSLYKIKININSIINFAYLKQFVIRSLL